MSSACLRRLVSRSFSLRSVAFSSRSGSRSCALRPRFRGVRPDRVPASRWRRQVVRFEEYSPSLRKSAPRLPGTVQASASLKMRSLSAAVKRRLAALAGTSGSGAAAGAARCGSAAREVSTHGRVGTRRVTAMLCGALIVSTLMVCSPPRPLL
jgi:hypothetical protein